MSRDVCSVHCWVTRSSHETILSGEHPSREAVGIEEGTDVISLLNLTWRALFRHLRNINMFCRTPHWYTDGQACMMDDVCVTRLEPVDQGTEFKSLVQHQCCSLSRCPPCWHSLSTESVKHWKLRLIAFMQTCIQRPPEEYLPTTVPWRLKRAFDDFTRAPRDGQEQFFVQAF